MAQYVLAYVSSCHFSDADVEELARLAERLATDHQWSREPPIVVDQLEEDSRTRPEDELVRTVGLALWVSSPGEYPSTPVDEPTRIIDALVEFSKAHGIDFELQLDDCYVGEIRGGVPDELVHEGLLAGW